MKPLKVKGKRRMSAIALGAFALTMAAGGPRSARGDCIQVSLTCYACGGGYTVYPCCVSASCWWVEARNGNCDTSTMCETMCTSGDGNAEQYYCP